MGRNTIVTILFTLLLETAVVKCSSCIHFNPESYPEEQRNPRGEPPPPPPPATNVEWWVVWKDKEKGSNSFYMDSISQKPVPLSASQLNKYLVHHTSTIDDANWFARYASNNFHNVPLHSAGQKVLEKEEREYANTVLPLLDTIALYFNDQFTIDTKNLGHFGVQTFKHDIGWVDYTWKQAHSKFMLAIDVNSDSGPVKTTGGFILQHTMPQSPGASINNYVIEEKKNFFNFVQELDPHNAGLMSQHAFCVNIQSETLMLAALQGLVKSRPKFIHANIDRILLNPIREQQTDFSKYLGKLIDEYWGAEHDECRNAWMKKRQTVAWTEIMKDVPAECFEKIELFAGPQDDNNNGNPSSKIVMFTHAATPHSHRVENEEEKTITTKPAENKKRTRDDSNFSNNKMKDQDDEIINFDPKDESLSMKKIVDLAHYADQRKPKMKKFTGNEAWQATLHNPPAKKGEYHARSKYVEIIVGVQKKLIADAGRTKRVHSTYFGPIHWDEVARQLDDPNDPIPLMVTCWKNTNLPSLFNVQLVNEFGGVSHGRRHEKIGIAAVEESSEGRHWVCFGDANHRTSEISHAGMTICLQNKAVWMVMKSMVKDIYKIPHKLLPFSKKSKLEVAKVDTKQTYSWRIKPDGTLDEYSAQNNNNNMDTNA